MGPRDLLILTARTLGEAGVPYFVTGSVGAMVFGEFRLTTDIDVCVQLSAAHARVLETCFSEPDFYLSPHAMRDAIRCAGQFNVIHIPSGLKIDLMVPANTAFNRSRWARVRHIDLGDGHAVPFSSPEDIMLMKLVFRREGGSDKHLRDIASMFRVSGEIIDRAYLARWAPELQVQDELAAVLARLGL